MIEHQIDGQGAKVAKAAPYRVVKLSGKAGEQSWDGAFKVLCS